jgi:hypothetical protein
LSIEKGLMIRLKDSKNNKQEEYIPRSSYLSKFLGGVDEPFTDNEMLTVFAKRDLSAHDMLVDELSAHKKIKNNDMPVSISELDNITIISHNEKLETHIDFEEGNYITDKCRTDDFEHRVNQSSDRDTKPVPTIITIPITQRTVEDIKSSHINSFVDPISPRKLIGRNKTHHSDFSFISYSSDSCQSNYSSDSSYSSGSSGSSSSFSIHFTQDYLSAKMFEHDLKTPPYSTRNTYEEEKIEHSETDSFISSCDSSYDHYANGKVPPLHKPPTKKLKHVSFSSDTKVSAVDKPKLTFTPLITIQDIIFERAKGRVVVNLDTVGYLNDYIQDKPIEEWGNTFLKLCKPTVIRGKQATFIDASDFEKFKQKWRPEHIEKDLMPRVIDWRDSFYTNYKRFNAKINGEKYVAPWYEKVNFVKKFKRHREQNNQACVPDENIEMTQNISFLVLNSQSDINNQTKQSAADFGNFKLLHMLKRPNIFRERTRSTLIEI